MFAKSLNPRDDDASASRKANRSLAWLDENQSGQARAAGRRGRNRAVAVSLLHAPETGANNPGCALFRSFGRSNIAAFAFAGLSPPA